MTPEPALLIETFPALQVYADTVAHGFVVRVPGVDVCLPKAEVLDRLAPAYWLYRWPLKWHPLPQ